MVFSTFQVVSIMALWIDGSHLRNRPSLYPRCIPSAQQELIVHITCERYQTNPKKKRDARVIGIPFRSQVIPAISLTLSAAASTRSFPNVQSVRSKTTPLIIHPNSTPPNVISLTLKHCSNQCRRASKSLMMVT